MENYKLMKGLQILIYILFWIPALIVIDNIPNISLRIYFFLASLIIFLVLIIVLNLGGTPEELRDMQNNRTKV